MTKTGLWCTAVLITMVSMAASAAAQQTTPPEPGNPGPALVVTGSYFVRYELRENYDELGVSAGRFQESDATFYRLRMGLGVGPIDIGGGRSVSVQLTPQSTGVFGTLPSTVADASFGLHEGYLRLQTPLVRFDVGRFEMNYGDAFVIGNLDWNETARSFDGARAHFTSGPGGAWVDLFVTQVAEGRPFVHSPFSGGDAFFLGVYGDVGPWLAKGLALQPYALVKAWPRAYGLPDPNDPMAPPVDAPGATQVTLGLLAKQRVGAFDYRIEPGLEVGRRRAGTPPDNPTVLAYQADAEVGAHALADRLRIALEGEYASGDDPGTRRIEGWDQLYPTAHKWLGLADIIGGRTNVGSVVAHVQLHPVTQVALSVDGHVFFRPEGTRGYVGSEIDTGAAWHIGHGLVFRGMYALFIPDASAYPSDVPAHYLEVELRYDLNAAVPLGSR